MFHVNPAAEALVRSIVALGLRDPDTRASALVHLAHSALMAEGCSVDPLPPAAPEKPRPLTGKERMAALRERQGKPPRDGTPPVTRVTNVTRVTHETSLSSLGGRGGVSCQGGTSSDSLSFFSEKARESERDARDENASHSSRVTRRVVELTEPLTPVLEELALGVSQSSGVKFTTETWERFVAHQVQLGAALSAEQLAGAWKKWLTREVEFDRRRRDKDRESGTRPKMLEGDMDRAQRRRIATEGGGHT